MSAETGRRTRPKPFAEDWSFPGTARPPTTVANPLGALPREERAGTGAGAGGVDVEGGIDLSPDGTEVTFAWDRSGALEIYTAPLVGDRIIQLTSAGKRSVAPRWSPDGRWVAFLRESDDSGKPQIWLVDRDGAHERRLTDDPVEHREIAWSPDGTKLAYSADPGGAFAIYAMEVASGEHHRLTEGWNDDARPRWSPDGGSILFTRRDTTATNADLYVVAHTGGEARRLETRDGLDGGSKQGEWSPDGSTVAFTTSARGRWEIAFAHLRDGAVARVERAGATPFEDTDPTWRPDGRAVLYRHAKDGDVSVRRVFTISHADEAVLDLPGVYGSARVAPDGETVVAAFAAPGRPADVVVRPKGSPEIRRITSSQART